MRPSGNNLVDASTLKFGVLATILASSLENIMGEYHYVQSTPYTIIIREARGIKTTSRTPSFVPFVFRTIRLSYHSSFVPFVFRTIHLKPGSLHPSSLNLCLSPRFIFEEGTTKASARIFISNHVDHPECPYDRGTTSPMEATSHVSFILSLHTARGNGMTAQQTYLPTSTKFITSQI